MFDDTTSREPLLLPTGTTETADRDLLPLSLNQTGRYELLTREDEQRLGRTIDAGRAAARVLGDDPEAALPVDRRRELTAAVKAGERASKAFVEANLRLVVSVAKRYRSSGVPL